MVFCLNCNIQLRRGLHWYEYWASELSSELVSILEEWTSCEITNDDRLCHECLIILVRENENRGNLIFSGRQLGHREICLSCGISVAERMGRRRHRLYDNTAEMNIIALQIFPRLVPDEAYVCFRCWLRLRQNSVEPIEAVAVNEQHIEADTRNEQPVEANAGNEQPVEADAGNEQPFEADADEQLVQADAVQNSDSVDPEENFSGSNDVSAIIPSSESDSWAGSFNPPGEPTPFIHLNHYRRTPENPNHCFVPDCGNAERHRVPLFLKQSILKTQKLFISSNARVCDHHITVYNWEMLTAYNFLSDFNAQQIDEMMNLLSDTTVNCVINFERIESVDDNICHYWTGLTILQFLTLFNSVVELNNTCKKAKTALGLYLIKLRTGESMARIATLFLMAQMTVSRYINKVRNCLIQHYVPLHLGVDHITRAEHSARNLLIPQGLFGTEGNNPIVICDGTYIYVQKSSNYLYQKKTWSLHKYQNLVKPFLMVATDGHIIDVFGPYAATDTDADIMKALFENAQLPLRSYFRENDVFILDRGFRDSLGLLSSLGYNVHKPESLDAGETQLSTIKANKTRCVTLCRWVVEVVNGRFKRDYKLLRNRYFNIYSKNLMPDFKIAAALINNFHPVIAISRVEMPNRLSDIIIEQRINRNRSNFISINAQLPELHVFPTMQMEDLVLFGLGTYQIKQARSYYGEHIRQHGTFIIEVDTNLSHFDGNKLLLRSKIKSRHISNKQYLQYILLNLNGEDWCQRIEQYYCTCIIGKRTVGSCAHIMTIVWYLGWARFQNSIYPPARFLDDILICNEDE